MDIHSSENQKILRKFVEREVVMLASDIVDALQQSNLEWFESWDITNLYRYPCSECGGEMKQQYDSDDHNMPLDIWICESCNHTTNDEPDTEMQEVYEYWFVSKFLAEKLEEKGEVIIKEFNHPIWGRCTTGQAIFLDGVMGNIGEEMEILDGQKYAWNV